MSAVESQQEQTQQVPASEKKTLSRREFLVQKVKWALGARVAMLGIPLLLTRSSESLTPRDYTKKPSQFWTIGPEHGIRKEAGELVATVVEQQKFHAQVIDIDHDPERVFTEADIPDPDDEFPLLALYSEKHEDQTQEIKSFVKRILARSRDLMGVDRMLLILTKEGAAKPGVLTQYENDSNVEELTVFPMIVQGDENLIEALEKYFGEFHFSPELLAKIQAREVTVYWRNYGSKLGHGPLPDIYMIK